MIINYETSKYVKEKCQMEIEDTKNIFLQGTNPYDGLNTYFGIWTTENSLIIATLISGRNVRYESYINRNLYTESDIREFLTNNNNVKIISKDIFKEQINNIKSILEI